MSQPQPDCIFIDDEPFCREAWLLTCQQAGKRALVFQSAAELLAVAPSLPRTVPIFLDVDLRDDMSGEELAIRLFDLGFVRLYYATDHDESFLERPKWLAGIIGKEVPDWVLREK